MRQKYFLFCNQTIDGVLFFKHDAGMLAESGLLNNLQRFAISPTGQPMCIYGAPACPLRVHLQAPFRQGRLTPHDVKA